MKQKHDVLLKKYLFSHQLLKLIQRQKPSENSQRLTNSSALEFCLMFLNKKKFLPLPALIFLSESSDQPQFYLSTNKTIGCATSCLLQKILNAKLLAASISASSV